MHEQLGPETNCLLSLLNQLANWSYFQYWINKAVLFDSSYWFFDLQPKFSLPTEHLRRSLISLPKGRTKNILSYLSEKERWMEKDQNDGGETACFSSCRRSASYSVYSHPNVRSGLRVGFLFSITGFFLLKTSSKDDNKIFIMLPPHSWLEPRTVVFIHLQPTWFSVLFLASAPGTEQTQGRGWTIYYDRMDPPLCSRGPLPHTRFTLPTTRERHLSTPEVGEKERDYFFKELYKLKSNDLMSSLRSQSPLECPQTHSPSFLLWAVWGTISQKKK